MRISVFGAGAWGTALAQTFSGTHEVTLWGRESDNILEMQRTLENRLFLPDIKLSPNLTFSDNFEEAALAELYIIATPLAGLRSTTRALADYNKSKQKPLLWACKGLEVGTARLPHEIVADELGPDASFGTLAGPTFAAEVARGLPATIALASKDAAFANDFARMLHHPRLRIYANNDVIGCEIGGALKNVIAIAAGVSDGMGFGLNARAGLITRGLAEMARLAKALGGHYATLMGLAGMGDLILTCTGDLSRNRQVGLALAQGKKLPDILAELGHVAEGVPTAHEVAHLAERLGIEMPLATAVDALLHRDQIAREIVEQLLSREPTQ